MDEPEPFIQIAVRSETDMGDRMVTTYDDLVDALEHAKRAWRVSADDFYVRVVITNTTPFAIRGRP